MSDAAAAVLKKKERSLHKKLRRIDRLQQDEGKVLITQQLDLIRTKPKLLLELMKTKALMMAGRPRWNSLSS